MSNPAANAPVEVERAIARFERQLEELEGVLNEYNSNVERIGRVSRNLAGPPDDGEAVGDMPQQAGLLGRLEAQIQRASHLNASLSGYLTHLEEQVGAA